MIKRGKKSQLFGMPFSIIFSIFLIIFFLIAAWVGIKIFWSPGCDCAFSDQSQEGMFKDNFQIAIDDVWNSAGADRNFKINLPSKIERVCFMDYNSIARGTSDSLFKELRNGGSGNMYLYPLKCACTGFKVLTMKHINITDTTKTNNPLCIDNGKELWISTSRGGPVKIYTK
jgi:hypothetical protein